jgi:hypothetical protein
MGMKRIPLMVCLAAAFLAACGPSTQALQTTDAETRAAVPTSTSTPVPPTNTPTELPTLSLAPTLDLISLQDNLKEFLVQESDLPPLANYTPHFRMPASVSNESISQSMSDDGVDFLEKTGRIDGWEVEVDFDGDVSLGITPFILYNQAALFNTVEGAQLAISKYCDRYVMQDGFTETNSPFTNGDVHRAFYRRYQEPPGNSGYSLKYIIVFSYRNVVVTVQESGLERPIDPVFMSDIAQRLLARFQASPLLNP